MNMPIEGGRIRRNARWLLRPTRAVGAGVGMYIPLPPPFGPVIGSAIFGGYFIYKYEFDGGSDFIKSTTTDILLRLNGKKE
ncbi:hypothetical protein IHQ56_11865 [Methylobacillus flagellatus]|nr:hypothetical protein [Methylobacillus flagellatus]